MLIKTDINNDWLRSHSINNLRSFSTITKDKSWVKLKRHVTKKATKGNNQHIYLFLCLYASKQESTTTSWSCDNWQQNSHVKNYKQRVHQVASNTTCRTLKKQRKRHPYCTSESRLAKSPSELKKDGTIFSTIEAFLGAVWLGLRGRQR